MDTALADSVCCGLESPNARMSCFSNKVGFLFFIFIFSSYVMRLMWLSVDHGSVGSGECW